ncbi:hypothetical protein GCM10027589_24530 [Actinocorallia lasiicapitis]
MSVVVRLLGPVDVTVDGNVHPTPGLRRKAVLARLAMRPGEVVSVDGLIDAVWGGDHPATAQNTLQSHVSYLRRVLGAHDVITARAPGYRLAHATTDLRLAEDLIEEAQAQISPERRLSLLDQALRLWRGRPLADVTELPWFAHEAERLERVRRDAQRTAVECKLELGLHTKLVPELEALTDRYPFDEDLQAQLVIAMYRSGRQADALAIVRRTRIRLRDELGIDLSAQLRELESAVLRQDPGLDLVKPTPAALGAPVRTVSSTPSLVERAAAIEAIETVLDRVVSAGTGGVLVFEGPAGFGKTSVLDHAGAKAAAHGFAVLTARGTELETDYAWACAEQLFRRHADVAEVLDRRPGATDSGPAGEYPIINALYWLVSDLAARGPVLIVVDDLHWADSASVRFLAYLAARLDGLPVALVIGTRPVPERLGNLVSVIGGFPFSTTQVLRPLSLSGSADLIAEVITTGPDQELIEQVHELCGGNPFLLREVARGLSGSGADGETGKVDLSEMVGDSPGFARFVSDQLRPMPARSVEVVRHLAVSGDWTGSDRLAKTTGLGTAEVLDALASPLSSRLVVSSGTPARFSFAHPLIRRAVYDALPVGLRTDLHLRAADVAVQSQDLTMAATHLLHVPPGIGDHDPVPVLGAAAKIGLSRGSVEAAVTFLRRILDEDLGDHRPRAVAELGMAEVLVDNQRAIEHLSEALSLESDSEKRAQISHVLATALWLDCRPRDAAQICKAALEREAEASPGARQSLQALIVLMAYTARYASDLMELIDVYKAQTIDPSIGGLSLLSCLADHDMHQNRRERAEQQALEVLRGDNLRKLLRDPLGEQGASMAWYTLTACDSPHTLPSLETALDHYLRAGSLRGIGPVYFYRSRVMYSYGYLADALSDVRRSWEAVTLSGQPLGQTYIIDVLLRTLVSMGKTDEAVAALRAFEQTDWSGLTATMHVAGASAVHLAIGDVQRAYETALAARDDCRTRPIVNPVVADWHGPMVRCLTLLGRHDEAQATAREMLEVATEWNTPRAVGKALRAVASTEPHDREAVDLLEESVRVLQPTPAKLELARSLHAYGNALNGAGHTADAITHLYRGLELAILCGAIPLRNSITHTLHTIAGHRFVPPVVTDLTPIETEISALAERGATEREIARALHLTLNAVQEIATTIRKKRA